MFRTLSFMFILINLTSCNSIGNRQNCEMIRQEDGTAHSSCFEAKRLPSTGNTSDGDFTYDDLNPGVPTAAQTWNANIYYDNFSAEQEAKVEIAIALIKKVIASQEFKDRVINHTYEGKKTYVDSKGLSNTQIYRKILEAAERMGITSRNNTMDVELELYHAATTTIGYTYPNVTRIWMNTKYFDKYTPHQVAGNLMHEWVHKLGFGHAIKWSKSRDYSVPYAVGYLMEQLTKKYQ